MAWRPVPESRRVRGFAAWDLILVLDLAVIGIGGAFTVLAGPATQGTGLPADELRLLAWLNVVFGLVLFALLPVLWLLATRARPVEGTLRYLRLKVDAQRSWSFWLGAGCFLAVGLYVAVVALFVLLGQLGAAPGGDPVFGELAAVGTWPLMVAIAVGAGVGEEVLFRGVLQRGLGWIGQGAVFGILHVNQGYVAVAFITLLALLFGWLLKKGMPLWSLMVAHASYDLLLLGQVHIGAQA